MKNILPKLFIKQFIVILSLLFFVNSLLTFIPTFSQSNSIFTYDESTLNKNIETKLTNKSGYDDSKVIELDENVSRLVKFLQKNNSPIATIKYAEIIIETSKENGADYRINVGIMMAESGLCRKPVKKYNCYGYLDQVQYKSFEDGLEKVTAKVSQQYTSKYAWNIEKMGEAYGVHNVSHWESKVRFTANQLPL